MTHERFPKAGAQEEKKVVKRRLQQQQHRSRKRRGARATIEISPRRLDYRVAGAEAAEAAACRIMSRTRLISGCGLPLGCTFLPLPFSKGFPLGMRRASD